MTSSVPAPMCWLILSTLPNNMSASAKASCDAPYRNMTSVSPKPASVSVLAKITQMTAMSRPPTTSPPAVMSANDNGYCAAARVHVQASSAYVLITGAQPPWITTFRRAAPVMSAPRASRTAAHRAWKARARAGSAVPR